MARLKGLAVAKLNFEGNLVGKRGLRLLTPLERVVRGPEKYRILDLKRRRAQIRARRELDLVD
jgi:hypothetical protein